MSAVAVIATLLLFVTFIASYAIYLSYFPPAPADMPSLLPEPQDYALLAICLLIGLSIAIVIALRLAKRILAPLNSLADGARRIAAGDLSARAAPGDRSLGETALLVDDFNLMAERLEETARSMSSSNAAIAHELRTPLTILRGRLQGLLDGVFQPDEATFRNLLAQTDNLTRIVEDLRVVTLSENQRLEMTIEPTDLGSEVEGAVEAFRPALEKAGFRVDTDLQHIVLACDGVRIRQALFALLENARRYATPGRLLIAMQRGGGAVVLSVEDVGPGLAPDFAARAFETFTRAEPSRSRQLGGSGLGLSVVRAIAEAHRGHASYRRSSAGGAIFEISLPA
jgi:two-component system sensor histidine kinase AdeS